MIGILSQVVNTKRQNRRGTDNKVKSDLCVTWFTAWRPTISSEPKERKFAVRRDYNLENCEQTNGERSKGFKSRPFKPKLHLSLSFSLYAWAPFLNLLGPQSKNEKMSNRSKSLASKRSVSLFVSRIWHGCVKACWFQDTTFTRSKTNCFRLEKKSKNVASQVIRFHSFRPYICIATRLGARAIEDKYRTTLDLWRPFLDSFSSLSISPFFLFLSLSVGVTSHKAALERIEIRNFNDYRSHISGLAKFSLSFFFRA